MTSKFGHPVLTYNRVRPDLENLRNLEKSWNLKNMSKILEKSWNLTFFYKTWKSHGKSLISLEKSGNFNFQKIISMQFLLFNIPSCSLSEPNTRHKVSTQMAKVNLQINGFLYILLIIFFCFIL